MNDSARVNIFLPELHLDSGTGRYEFHANRMIQALD